MAEPSKRDDPYRKRRGPEDEPFGTTGSSRSRVKIIAPIIIGVIIVSVIAVSSVRTVDAGNRGVLVQFGNVDTSRSLDEGLHFVVPFRDNVVEMEVRTQKIVEDTISQSGDLQDVSTQVALNFHIDPAQTQVLYQRLGFDYANRIIIPAIQESVKQVTARFNAEQLITERETVKNQIEDQITARLAANNIIVDALSITDFQFSPQFSAAVEAKVEAQQRALQAQNELRRIQIEAQQNEAQAIGEQKANIARAEGMKRSNVLQAEGEAQAVTTISEQLRNSPTYLEWLKSTKWDGVLPLVTGGAGSQTPFIDIPRPGSQGQASPVAASGNTTTASRDTGGNVSSTDIGGQEQQEQQQEQQQQNQTGEEQLGIANVTELENLTGTNLSEIEIGGSPDTTLLEGIGEPQIGEVIPGQQQDTAFEGQNMSGEQGEQQQEQQPEQQQQQQEQQQQNQTGEKQLGIANVTELENLTGTNLSEVGGVVPGQQDTASEGQNISTEQGGQQQQEQQQQQNQTGGEQDPISQLTETLGDIFGQ